MVDKLVYRAEGQPRERVLDHRPFTIGRDESTDLTLPDEVVSRRHARLDWDGRDWWIVDTESRNRVQVNGVCLPAGDRGARRLEAGDVISLGGLELSFERDGSEHLELVEEMNGGTTTSRRRVIDFDQLLARQGGSRGGAEGKRLSISRAERILGVVTALGRRLAADRADEPMLDSIVDLVFECTPAERAAVLLWDDGVGDLVPRVARHRSSDGPDGDFRVPGSVVRRAFAERCTVRMEPDQPPSASVCQLRLRSAVAVPLGDEARAFGVVYADSAVATGIFDDFTLDLVSALAGYAAAVIEKTRLLERLQAEERTRERLARYLSVGVVERILASGQPTSDLALEAGEAEVTVVFCDMVNFTAIVEDLAPEEAMDLINLYFGCLTDVVFENGGTLDKFIGDCVMAVFGAPFPQPDHARRAALTALGFRDVVERLRREAGYAVDFRIGMNSGRVVAGDVGHVRRREWTVLGSTVNLASRMESTVAESGQIVLTGETKARLGDEFELRRIEVPRRPKGIKRDFEAWELVGVV